MVLVSRHTWQVSLGLAIALVGCDRSQPLDPMASTAPWRTVTAPSGTNAVAVSETRVDVSWQDNSDNESGFEVYESITGLTTFSLAATPGANVTTQSLTGMGAGREYCFEVRAFTTKGTNRAYSEFSNIACATTPAPPPPPVPSAPSGLDATPTSSMAVDVRWIDNSTDEDGFRVERSLDAGSTWTFVGVQQGPNLTSYYDSGRASDQQVCYRVVAFNGYGSSPPSNSDCTAPPAGPTNLSATGADQQTIVLTWTDNSAVEDGYEVRRASPGLQGWGTVADLPANSTTYRDVAVTSNTTYYYMVRAKKDGGYSDLSNFVSAAAASAPPTAPSGTNASPTSSTEVTVGWVDNSSNEDGFRVERSTDGGASWVPAGTTGAWGGPITDGGRASEQQVCYRVIAFNALGDSPPSDTDCTAPPAGPTNLILTPVDQETIDLTWTDNSAVEDGYEVWVLDGSGEGPQPFAPLPANSTSYRFAGPYAYWYTYYVVATKDGGRSDFSNGAWGP